MWSRPFCSWSDPGVSLPRFWPVWGVVPECGVARPRSAFCVCRPVRVRPPPVPLNSTVSMYRTATRELHSFSHSTAYRCHHDTTPVLLDSSPTYRYRIVAYEYSKVQYTTVGYQDQPPQIGLFVLQYRKYRFATMHSQLGLHSALVRLPIIARGLRHTHRCIQEPLPRDSK